MNPPVIITLAIIVAILIFLFLNKRSKAHAAAVARYNEGLAEHTRATSERISKLQERLTRKGGALNPASKLDFRIRPYTQDDLIPLQDLCDELAGIGFVGQGLAEEVTSRSLKKEWRYLVAESGGKLIGCTGCSPNMVLRKQSLPAGGEALVYSFTDLMVKPGFHKKGVASALLLAGVGSLAPLGAPVAVCAAIGPIGRRLFNVLDLIEMETSDIPKNPQLPDHLQPGMFWFWFTPATTKEVAAIAQSHGWLPAPACPPQDCRR